MDDLGAETITIEMFEEEFPCPDTDYVCESGCCGQSLATKIDDNEVSIQRISNAKAANIQQYQMKRKQNSRSFTPSYNLKK